jgi:uncharacterized repeat protein (TIGR03803 family)
MKRVCILFILLSALSTAAHAQIKMLHEFAGGADDGANPMFTRLLQSGSTLYGMTSAGGDSDWGVIFSFPLWSPPVPALSAPGMIIFAVLLLGIILLFISRKRRQT